MIHVKIKEFVYKMTPRNLMRQEKSTLTLTTVNEKSTFSLQVGTQDVKSHRISSSIQGYVSFLNVVDSATSEAASGIPIKLEIVQIIPITTAALVVLVLN